MNQKRAEIIKLDKEKENIQQEINYLIEDYDITKDDLDEYRANRPFLVKIDKLNDIINNKDEQIFKIRKKMLEYKAEILLKDYDRCVSEKEFDNINQKLSKDNPLDIQELSKIVDEIYKNPSRYIDIVISIRQQLFKK